MIGRWKWTLIRSSSLLPLVVLRLCQLHNAVKARVTHNELRYVYQAQLVLVVFKGLCTLNLTAPRTPYPMAGDRRGGEGDEARRLARLL